MLDLRLLFAHPRSTGIRPLGCAVFMIAGSVVMQAATKPATTPPRADGRFTATAYSVTGITKSGEYTHRHVVAADPAILPIGTRIRVRRAGKYSGEYVVADTGEKIVGRKLDIYMPNTPECKKFGVKKVRVKVLEVGDGTRESAKETDKAIKQAVAQDVAKGTVGHAATELDWATKGGPAKAAAIAASGSNPANPATPVPAVITPASTPQ